MPPEQSNDMSEAAYTAIVVAGKRPGVDPVASAHGETYKALVPVHGMAMIARVLKALSNARRISRIVIATDDAMGPLEAIPGVADARMQLPVSHSAAAPSISASVLAALASRPEDARFLIVTADHPLVTPNIVDDFTKVAATRDGVSVAMVARHTIEMAYPDMERTYLRFRGSEVSGANLFAINDRNGLNAIRFWEKIEKERKKPWKLVAAFGLINLIGFTLRLFTIDRAFARASKFLQCPVYPVILPHADAAVDVDKPSDLVAVEAILARRNA